VVAAGERCQTSTTPQALVEQVVAVQALAALER
jgi:hypothetical protein